MADKDFLIKEDMGSLTLQIPEGVEEISYFAFA